MEKDPQPQPGLGALLRALLERLDGEVERLYREEGAAFRPKYYPLVRVLLGEKGVSLSRLAAECGVTHSAVSQTVSEMVGRGLVEARPGVDARERLVSLTAKGRRACADLAPLWEAIHVAADELDAELAVPLSRVAAEALGALDRQPFGQRVRKHRAGKRRRSAP